MRRSQLPVYFALFVLSLLLALPLPLASGVITARAQNATPQSEITSGAPLLLFAVPGMQQDLLARFSTDGALPTMSAMDSNGASGSLVDPSPATTGTVLSTFLTGAWPAEHGIVGDTFFRTGSPSFTDVSQWNDPGLLQADTLAQAAERAGKQVVAIGWDGAAGLDPALAGPVVGEPIALSQAGLVTNRESDSQATAASVRNLGYDAIALRVAEGWIDAPESFSPAQETAFTIRSLDATGPNPDRTIEVYIYDSTDDGAVNYDRILVAPDKNAAGGVQLDEGAWAPLSLALSGEQEGVAAGLWLHVNALAADLRDFRLYYTPVSRYQASWAGCEAHPDCVESGGLADLLTEALGPAVAVDVAPLEAGIIDGDLFSSQGIMAARQGTDALRLIVEQLGVEPDLLLLATSFPGAATRAFLGQMTNEEVGDGIATPTVAVDANASQTDPESLLRESYTLADELLADARDLLGDQASALVVSSDGVAPTWRAVNVGQVLADAGLAEQAQPQNCIPGVVSAPPGTPDPEALPVGPAVKACWSGGTAHIYVNLDGREAAGSVAEDDYNATRQAIVDAFNALRDAENPDAPVVANVFLKEELRDVGGADALHPSRTGDVVVTLAPPYRFENLAGGVVTETEVLAVDGYELAEGSGWLLAEGPAIAQGTTVEARAVDVAPTAAFLLGVPGPYNASGNILISALLNGDTLRQVTILDISDFHGQLPPLTATADNIDAEEAVNAAIPVGGIAALDAWFERYRAEATGPVLLVTAGDEVGATPPISTAFGDVPTIEFMNALGFTADALGNHNFDAGAEYMFGTLAPLANYPYLSANLVPEQLDMATPPTGAAPFQPSLLVEQDGVTIGLVGFSTPEIPNLTRPGALGPYRVIDPVQPVNAAAAKLRADGAEAIIALGHMGATGGTLSGPTGPVVELADQLRNVDVVIGDHTDAQVSSLRPNGVLLVENRSKGVMFTRVRVVIDAESGQVVYRTSDFHRPWVVGMTLDPAIIERLDQLQAELAPTLGQVIGSATKAIPRADACGMETGRTCESLIGDLITDAMRLTYGTDFALTNSGGIRADLTCPPGGGDFCPSDGEQNQITQGQVLTVLPFGNVAVTLEVNGAELKEMLEVGVSSMPEASGAFPQVSGFCFSYDITAEPGSRVTGAVRQAGDGSCTGDAIDLTDAATYTLTTNDFTASGGDGYPDLMAKASTRDVLAQIVADAIASGALLDSTGEPLDPTIEGRITCEGEGCPAPASP